MNRRLALYLTLAAFGAVLGFIGRLAEPHLRPVDKIAACERYHSAAECRQTWIVGKGQSHIK